MRSEMPKTVRNEKLFEKNNAHNLNCGQGHSGSDRVLFFGEDMLAILCGMQHCRPLVAAVVYVTRSKISYILLLFSQQVVKFVSFCFHCLDSK